MVLELEPVDKKATKEIKLIFKRFTIKNWDYFSLFLTLFGLIMIVSGFWETETILWNRIKYTTGSQWQNADPIYSHTSLQDLSLLLYKNISYYIMGNILLIISIIVLVIQYNFKKKWFKTTKITLILLGFTSFLAFFTSFWMKTSIPIIGDLPAFGGTVSGYQWIRIDIGSQSLLLEILSIIFIITSWEIFFIVLAIVLKFKNLNRVRNKRALLEKMEGKIAVKESSVKNFFKSLLKNLPFYIILVAYLLFTLFPVILAIRASMSTPYEIANGITPRTPLESFILNYSSVMFAISRDEPSFASALFRSLILGFGTSTLGLAISVSSGYGLARFKFKGKTFLTFIILATQMFPAIILLIPQYVILSSIENVIGTILRIIALVITIVIGFFITRYALKSISQGRVNRKFKLISIVGLIGVIIGVGFGLFYLLNFALNGLLNSLGYWMFGLLIVMATGATAYVTWMMKGYFETIPVDIEEAALIDGYGRFSTFVRIALPLAKSGMVAVMVFTFLSAWQEFVLARTFIQDNLQSTLPLLFFNFQNLNAPDTPTFFELLSPYSVLVAIPVVAFYLLLQKQLVGGVTAGGIK